jgi:hypothetical protein
LAQIESIRVGISTSISSSRVTVSSCAGLERLIIIASTLSRFGRTIGCAPRSAIVFTSSSISGCASAGPSTSTRSPSETSSE